MNIRATIPAPTELRYIRISDAPLLYSLSRSTFYRAVNRGELTIYKRGGASLLKVSEVDQWIEEDAV